MDAVLCLGVDSSFSLPTVIQTAFKHWNDHQQHFHLYSPNRSITQTFDCLLKTIVHEEWTCGQLFAANKLVDRLLVGEGFPGCTDIQEIENSDGLIVLPALSAQGERGSPNRAI